MNAEWSNRSAGLSFVVVGATALTMYVLAELVIGDAAYYDAETFGDYATVVMVTSILVLNGVAVLLLWRNPPVRRGSVFLLLAGIGTIAEGVGNLLEDVFGIEGAVWAFFGGGMLYMVSLLLAGIAALTVASPNRWSGLFLLLGVPSAMLGFGWVITAITWVVFGFLDPDPTPIPGAGHGDCGGPVDRSRNLRQRLAVRLPRLAM